MSQGSIRTFLLAAKRQLSHKLKNQDHISFVIGNESADLDSIACALLYGYIQSSQVQAPRSGNFLIPVTNIPSADLSLRPELTALLQHADIKPSELITLDDLPLLQDYPRDKTSWTLVDHNAFLGPLGRRFSARVTGVIDHHDDERRVGPSVSPHLITKSGSCASLVAEHCRAAWEALSAETPDDDDDDTATPSSPSSSSSPNAASKRTWAAQAAKLALGPVLIDTANLKDEHKVTDHDVRAVEFLEALVRASPEEARAYDRGQFYSEIDDARSDLDGLTLHDILRKDYKQWEEEGMTLGVAAVVRSLEYLRGKEGDFGETVVRFARERRLPIFAIVTGYVPEGAGGFARQLLLVAVEDGEARGVVERFVEGSRDELRLEELGYERPPGVALGFAWDQRNLAASRKQVAPLLRQAMRGAKVSAKC